MMLQQFIDKWSGQNADWDNYYAGQCVDLFRYYCDEVMEIKQPAGVWGAANFWTNFESDTILKENFNKIPNDSDFTPQEGDVMIWNFNAGGGYGHIAICTGENTGTQYFKSFDQNWSRVSYCEIVNHSYKNVYGVLRPKILSTQDDMPNELLDKYGVKDTDELDYKINEHVGTDWGGGRNSGYLGAEREKNKRLETENQGLKEEIDRLKAESAENYAQAELRKKEIQKFKEELAKKLFLPAASDQTDIISSIERLLTVEDQLTEANKTISKKEQEFATKEKAWTSEIEELKSHIKTLTNRLENLEQEIESGKTEKAENDWFKSVVDKILSIFNKEK
jgi:prefoldin subunit 5